MRFFINEKTYTLIKLQNLIKSRFFSFVSFFTGEIFLNRESSIIKKKLMFECKNNFKTLLWLRNRKNIKNDLF